MTIRPFVLEATGPKRGFDSSQDADNDHVPFFWALILPLFGSKKSSVGGSFLAHDRAVSLVNQRLYRAPCEL